MDVAKAVSPLLETRTFGQRIRAYNRVDSTNTLAAEWAAAGAAEGSTVLAEFQAAGRGRMGRSWVATAGLNLTFSVVLRPRLAPDQWGLITMAAGVAVVDAVEQFTSPLGPEIKWPNDILLNGKKCCGMLLESAHVATRPVADARAVILGVGLNVNQEVFDAELEGRATSILLETGRFTDRPALLAALLSGLERTYTAIQNGRAEAVRSIYLRRLAALGKPATYRIVNGRGSTEGIIVGITETGALQLQTAEGIQVFHAGELTTSFGAAEFGS